MDYDTIAAIATPVGTSGIGIIRLSGNKAVSIVQSIYSIGKNLPTLHSQDLNDLPSNYLRHGHIFDPQKKQIVDEVMVVVMRSPRSYTREDVVEIQSHSGHVIMSTILKLVLDQGARLAQPGEFTKRAFLNGRIDLSQAEAVAEVITAKSEAALQLAATNLTGHLRVRIDDLIEKITTMQIELEARIEFPDEIDQAIDMVTIQNELEASVLKPINALLDQYRDGHFLRDGIRVGIVGSPNVGKSRLLNRILHKDKAIVTPIPGTTRDLIEESTCIEGVPVLITDTAGLRSSTDPVEIIGIQKTQKSAADSDVILFVVDGSQAFSEEDRAAFELIKNQRHIVCINKIDLIETSQNVVLPDICARSKSVRISAKTGEGIDSLKVAIKNCCLHDVKIEPGQSVVPNQRQKVALEDAQKSVIRALSGIEYEATEELIVSDLNEVKNTLNRIVGGSADGDILDEVFGKFCIGK